MKHERTESMMTDDNVYRNKKELLVAMVFAVAATAAVLWDAPAPALYIAIPYLSLLAILWCIVFWPRTKNTMHTGGQEQG